MRIGELLGKVSLKYTIGFTMYFGEMTITPEDGIIRRNMYIE